MADFKRKSYPGVDIFKMACAILVMIIHTKPFENIFWIDAGIGMVTRFAVPYFFTVSGYFLYKKVEEKSRGGVEDCRRVSLAAPEILYYLVCDFPSSGCGSRRFAA